MKIGCFSTETGILWKQREIQVRKEERHNCVTGYYVKSYGSEEQNDRLRSVFPFSCQGTWKNEYLFIFKYSFLSPSLLATHASYASGEPYCCLGTDFDALRHQSIKRSLHVEKKGVRHVVNVTAHAREGTAYLLSVILQADIEML